MRILFLRSLSLIIGSFLIAVLVYSCTQQTRYNIFDSTTINIIKQTGLSGDQVTQDNDTCKVGSFYVSFSFNFRSISHQSSNDWSLFSKANAFQPGPPIMHHLEKLKDLKFYTVNDFNANYPAGSELTDLVTISMNSDGGTPTTFVSIQEFVQNYVDKMMRLGVGIALGI